MRLQNLFLVTVGCDHAPARTTKLWKRIIHSPRRIVGVRVGDHAHNVQDACQELKKEVRYSYTET